MNQTEITRLFPVRIRRALAKACPDMKQLYEIRLRVNAPVILIYQGKEFFLTEDGRLSPRETEACFAGAGDLKETMEYISSYSMYAFEEEIRGISDYSGRTQSGNCRENHSGRKQN